MLHGQVLQGSGARNLIALFFLQGISEVPEILVNVHKQSREAGREERMEISSVINWCSTAPSENRAIYTSCCSSD